MGPRLRQFRAWLLHNGLFPKGKLAFITWYLLGLNFLLFAVQQVGDIFRSSFGKSLSGWIIFLTLLVVLFSTILGARWLSSRLLWRLRNRLIVTYVFIGVIPLALLITLAVGGFYLSAGQFATFIVTSRLDSELNSLEPAISSSRTGWLRNWTPARNQIHSATIIPMPGAGPMFAHGWTTSSC